MSSSAVQPPIARRLRAALYVLVLLAVATSSYGRDFTPVIIALAAALISWLLIEVPRNGWYVPKFLINLSLLGAAVYLFFEIRANLMNESIIVALGHFITAILLCKLFERKSRRDLIQILILSLLTVVSGAMFSSSNVIFALLLGAYLCVFVYAIILLNLHAEFETASAKADFPAALPANGDARFLGRDSRRIARRCLVGLTPVALIVFLIVPRARSAGFAGSWGQGAYQIGFSESIQFRDYGQLAESDVEVMHVSLSRNGEVVGSEFMNPYFRGQVLDAYTPGSRVQGQGWYRFSPAPRIDRQAPENLPAASRVVSQLLFLTTRSPMFARAVMDNDVSQEFDLTRSIAPLNGKDPLLIDNKIEQDYTILVPTVRTLFSLAPAASIQSDSKPGRLESCIYNARQMTLFSNDLRPSTHYTVFSYVLVGPELFSGEPSVPLGLLRPAFFDFRGNWVPPFMVSKEITALAHKIVPDLPADRPVPPERVGAVVAEFENYLKLNYPYSLRFARVDSRLDHTTDFLLNRKETGGYCEEFASAMVMLCRSVGINARAVTGFHGGEYNSIGKYYVIRQKDAHAWAEVYVPGVGWVTTDPSPVRGSPDAAPFFLSRWAREFSQLVQNAWLSTIVSFDNESRRVAFAWVAARFSELWDSITDAFATVRASFSKSSPLDPLMRIWLLAPILGLFLLTFWFFRKWRRDRRRYGQSGDLSSHRIVRHSGEIAFLDDLLRLVSRLSPRRPDLTPREYIEHVPLGAATADARWLVETAYGLRFGTLAASSGLRTQIAHTLRRIRDSVNHKG